MNGGIEPFVACRWTIDNKKKISFKFKKEI